MDANNLSKLTVAQIKTQLRSRGLSTTGNKGPLLQRLKDALGESSTSPAASRKRNSNHLGSAGATTVDLTAGESPLKRAKLPSDLEVLDDGIRLGPMRTSLEAIEGTRIPQDLGTERKADGTLILKPNTNNQHGGYRYGGYGGHGNSHFTKANVGVRAGRWYCEIRPGQSGGGLSGVRFGICTADFVPEPGSGGQRAASGDAWCFDIAAGRAVRLSAGKDNQRQQMSGYYGQREIGEEYGAQLNGRNASVVGLALDADARTIRFTVNGTDAGIAFRDVVARDTTKLLVPLISLMTSSANAKGVVVNLGSTRFAKAAPGYAFAPFHCPLSGPERAGLEAEFSKYARETDGMGDEGVQESERITTAGLEKLQEDLGVTDDEDPVLLLLAWKLNAVTTTFEITRREWISGLTFNRIPTVAALKDALPKWRTELREDDGLFRKFYNFVFDYVKDENATALELEATSGLWSMLLGDRFGRKWELMPNFLAFLNETDRKGVSRDAWQQLIHFMKTHPTSVAEYDTDGSWPLLFDYFVEWVEEQRSSAKTKKSQEDSSSSSSSSDSE